MKYPRVLSAAGVLSAAALAVLVNIAVARHGRRWDLTSAGLYTLSPATLETLSALPERIRLDVLLASSDPLSASLRLMLDEYRTRTEKLDVGYADPDRRPAQFLALQQKYGIEAGRTEDGRVVVDAAVVVSRAGGKPFFLSGAELVDEGEGEGQNTRSRLEQALTLALRSVLSDERPLVCFVTGHGEIRLDDGGPHGLGELAARLRKNNYEAVAVDTSLPNGAGALDRCRVAVLAAPGQPLSLAESERIRSFFEAGGNVLIFASPVPDSGSRGLLPLGLSAITRAAGIALDEDIVFEQDPARRLPGGLGDQFIGEPRQHEITLGLVGPKNDDLKILVSASRSLSRAGDAPAQAAELLLTSPEAFGMTDLYAWMKGGGQPARGPDDRNGPLAIAMAGELPPRSGAAKGEHGPRMVVVGTASPALGQSWQERALHGGAVFTESALSWLAARPAIVDIPDKPVITGARISEASLGEVARYVLLYMPAAAALLGLAVYLRRRSTEGGATPKE